MIVKNIFFLFLFLFLFLFFFLSCGQNIHIGLGQDLVQKDPLALTIAQIDLVSYDTVNKKLILKSGSTSTVGISSYNWSVKVSDYAPFGAVYLRGLGEPMPLGNNPTFDIPLIQNFAGNVRFRSPGIGEVSQITSLWIFGSLYNLDSAVSIVNDSGTIIPGSTALLKTEIENLLTREGFSFSLVDVSVMNVTAPVVLEIKIEDLGASNSGNNDFLVQVEESVVNEVNGSLVGDKQYSNMSLLSPVFLRVSGLEVFNINLEVTDNHGNVAEAQALFWRSYSGAGSSTILTPGKDGGTSTEAYVSLVSTKPIIQRMSDTTSVQLSDGGSLFSHTGESDSAYDFWGLDADSDLSYEQSLNIGPISFTHNYLSTGTYKGKFSADDQGWWDMGLGEVFSEYVIEVE